MIFLLIFALFLPPPTDADLAELGAILCGEACGMELETRQFIGRQLRHDWYTLGTDGMSKRWYGHKPNDAAIKLMREIFNEPAPTEQCRLIGSGRDAAYWKANGYLAPDAVADYRWEHAGMVVAAFDCRQREIKVTWWVECVGDRCPR